MGEGNQREFEISPGHLPFATNDVLQFVRRKELADGQTANGNHQPGAEYLHFGLQPLGTTLNLGVRGDAVAAFGVLPGEAAADRGHVDALSELCFWNSTRFLEPAEKRFACGPCKRPS